MITSTSSSMNDSQIVKIINMLFGKRNTQYLHAMYFLLCNIEISKSNLWYIKSDYSNLLVDCDKEGQGFLMCCL